MDDFSYLESGLSNESKGLLKNLSALGEKLKDLQLKMIEAQAAADVAKKEYEHMANVLMPQEMFSAGLDSLTLSSGGTLRIKRNFYCKPNKNKADKDIMMSWLKENGGEYLIKHEATVSGEDVQKLEDNGIPFAEDLNVNTTSLKSFLKDKLGVTTGVQQITIEQIPECMHFQEVVTTEIEI